MGVTILEVADALFHLLLFDAEKFSQHGREHSRRPDYYYLHTHTSLIYFDAPSNKMPAATSAIASRNESKKPGRKYDKRIPRPNDAAQSPTSLLNLSLLHLHIIYLAFVTVVRYIICTAITRGDFCHGQTRE